MNYSAYAHSLTTIAQRITDWATKYGDGEDEVYCIEVEKAKALSSDLKEISKSFDKRVPHAEKEKLSRIASNIFDDATTEVRFGVSYIVLKKSAATKMASDLAGTAWILNNLADVDDKS